MYKNLTKIEKQNLHTYNAYKILEICRAHRLPMSVHSTSIFFYRKLFEMDKNIDYDFKLLLKAIILLACKAENIHGDFGFLIKRLKIEEKNIVLEYENTLAYKLKFEFHLPSPYIRILGFIIVLQERGIIDVKSGILDVLKPEIDTLDMQFHEYNKTVNDGDEKIEIEDIDNFWASSVTNMDKILLIDNYYKLNVKECALAALVLPTVIYKRLLDKIDLEMVDVIRQQAIKVKLPSDEEINQMFAKLDALIE